ncbi:MAG: hypothetical protein JWN99_1640, partial [Ilumatobacteraceae bacterium]|nr:hypothetical protein [Ilumatobacteraceae bacterium]
AAAGAIAPTTAPPVIAPAADHDDTSTVLMPSVADGVPVRWIDVAAPWLAQVGGDPRGTRLAPVAVARVALRFDDDKADLIHDEEYEAIIHPLGELVDASLAVAVDHDDRDLATVAPTGANYVLGDAPIKSKAYWTKLERDLVDQLVRSRRLSVAANQPLKLFARPGEADDAFATRCLTEADHRADTEIAALKDKFETRIASVHAQMETAEGRADVLSAERSGKRNEEILSTMGSVLGGLLGGRRSRNGALGQLGRAAGRRGRTSAAGERLDAAQTKVNSLSEQLTRLEGDMENEVAAIDVKWSNVAKQITSIDVPLERTDVKVTQLLLGWLPVS